MKELIEIERVLWRYGIKHQVTINDEEIVISGIKEIRENIVIQHNGDVKLEMQNAVLMQVGLGWLEDYLRQSSEQRVKEEIHNVIEGRYPNQPISQDEIDKYYENGEFLTKYISGGTPKAHINFTY